MATMITIVQPHFYWPETTLKMFPLVLEHLERCGRICYKSEDKINKNSAERFLRAIIKSGHESVIEHISLTAIIICSRACSHQLVRHRIAAYSQESQRFCNYNRNKSLEVICPFQIPPGNYEEYGKIIEEDGQKLSLNDVQAEWVSLINMIYEEYCREIENGVKPEDARYLLPNATKTELAVTFNLRQWRHVFRERALNRHAQWEIRNIFTSILDDLKIKLPVLFEDLK